MQKGTCLDPGSKGLPRVFCTTQTLFAPVQLSFAPVQEDFGAMGPKDLLHPLLTTLGTFEVSGPCGRHSGSQPEGLKTVVRVFDPEGTIPEPHCNLNFASMLPLFHLDVASFEPLLPQQSLCSEGNPEPRFGKSRFKDSWLSPPTK